MPMDWIVMDERDIRDCGLRFEARTHRYYHNPRLWQVYLEVEYAGGGPLAKYPSIVLV